MAGQTYEAKSLDSWARAKGLRAENYQAIWDAKKEGKILSAGSAITPMELVAGLGEFEYLPSEPYSANFAGTAPQMIVECQEATEARGYARDLCGYMRAYWGSAFLDKSPFGNFVQPHFYLTEHACDSHGKWYQTLKDNFNIPLFILDLPVSFNGNKEAQIEYMVSDYQEAIEKMEQVTGRKYDDEKLLEAVEISTENMALWAKICLAQTQVPAPFDAKSLVSLMVPVLLGRWKKETLDFQRTLLEELEERVAHNIAHLATERGRLLHINTPPWYFLRLLRHPSAYGAVVLGPDVYFQIPGFFVWSEEGTALVAGKTPGEAGWELRAREDALRFIAYRERSRVLADMWLPTRRITSVVTLAKQSRSDGVILHFNRGCEAMAMGMGEIKLALQQEGIPTMDYDANFADPREFSQVQVIDRMEAFLESLGLSRLED